MNEYATAEFVMAGIVLAFGLGLTIFAQIPIKLLLGVPLILVSLLGFYLGYECLDK